MKTMGAVVAILIAVGCGGDDGGGGGETTIDDQGGEVVVDVEGGLAGVDIPPGAVTEEVDVGVEAITADSLAELDEGLTMVSEPVAFTPHGTAFEIPVTISYTLDGGVPDNALLGRLDDENDTTWEYIDATIDGSTISAEVSTFSVYLVVSCDSADTDGDGVCDLLDDCPEDAGDDSDGDGSCDSDDPFPNCPGDDSDGNEICDNEEVRIQGTVTYEGAATPGLAVSILLNGTTAVAPTQITDGAGMYFVGELDAGTYTVSAIFYEQTAGDPICHVDEINDLVLELGDLETVNLDLTPGTCP